jgi:hypothetical protein
MSITVPLPDLREAAAHHGPAAFLLSTGSDGRPRVLHLVPEWGDARLVFQVSPRTAAAVAERSAVTILWPAATSGDHVGMSLIADGDAVVPGETPDGGGAGTVHVVLRHAVLHRAAPGQ